MKLVVVSLLCDLLVYPHLDFSYEIENLSDVYHSELNWFYLLDEACPFFATTEFIVDLLCIFCYECNFMFAV